MPDTTNPPDAPVSVKRVFRMIDGSRYEVEASTERAAIEHVERIFGRKTWRAIEIVGRTRH